jgi:hypothetical protein
MAQALDVPEESYELVFLAVCAAALGCASLSLLFGGLSFVRSC